MQKTQVREASHAGSWYTDNKKVLDKQLTEWLQKVEIKSELNFPIKGIIGPHAGFDYSGPTAAWAYKYFQKNYSKDFVRVFLLGPCHYIYGKNIVYLSSLDTYQTPLGNIQIDKDTIQELAKQGLFKFSSKDIEEQEHSLEMHLPYISKIFQNKSLLLVPLMVGSLTPEKEDYYGNILAEYFDQDDTLFIISSDFCHWGDNFDYYYYNKEDGPIYKSIEALDKTGINLIEKHDPVYNQLNQKLFNMISEFTKYLTKTENTICGRHPISVYLNIIKNSKFKDQLETKLTQYAQSSQVTKQQDSSVSYVSAITYLKNLQS